LLLPKRLLLLDPRLLLLNRLLPNPLLELLNPLEVENLFELKLLREFDCPVKVFLGLAVVLNLLLLPIPRVFPTGVLKLKPRLDDLVLDNELALPEERSLESAV